MRTRFLPLGAALALLLGLLIAAPAEATYAVESITFPGGNTEFYSPFGGPASIKFTFAGNELNATFNIRIRPAGGTAIHDQDVFVTADEPGLFEIEEFSWPVISVNSPKTYVVAVYRNGTQLASDSFFLHPRLVAITSAAPNPFLPWIDDGHKDTTDIRFNLATDATVEARVLKPNGAGKCCGALVRTDSLGIRPAGSNDWVWDGRDGDAHNLRKGNYFVRIWAHDGVVSPAVSGAKRIAIARTYRATATKSKPARSYHHRGPSTPLIYAGDCYVFISDGILQVLCQTARVSVFWRWGLTPTERIEKASFLIDDPNNECGPAKRRTGHSKHESFITVTDSASGRTLCEVVTARITYSFLKNS